MSSKSAAYPADLNYLFARVFASLLGASPPNESVDRLRSLAPEPRGNESSDHAAADPEEPTPDLPIASDDGPNATDDVAADNTISRDNVPITFQEPQAYSDLYNLVSV